MHIEVNTLVLYDHTTRSCHSSDDIYYSFTRKKATSLSLGNHSDIDHENTENKSRWQKVHPPNCIFHHSNAPVSHLACSIRHVMSIYHRLGQMTKHGSAGWVPRNTISICNDQRARRVSDSRPGCPSRMNKPLWRATKLRRAPHMHPSQFVQPYIYNYILLYIYLQVANVPHGAFDRWHTLARLQKGIPCSSFTMCYWITRKFSYGFQLQLEKVKLGAMCVMYIQFWLSCINKASKSAQMSSLDLSAILNLHIKLQPNHMRRLKLQPNKKLAGIYVSS